VASKVAVDVNARWYIIHTYVGHEDKVKNKLEQRIKSMDAGTRILRVEIPKENEIEIRSGQRRTVEKKMFPGYLMVQMAMDHESWKVVRETPGVTGFVGDGKEATPLEDHEADRILKQKEEGVAQLKIRFKKGENVRVVDGPFTDFIGTVDEINMGKGKVKVMLTLFGRETSVELDFLQVEKL
jgi:transcription termination/antitermination protein NusG